MNLFDPEMAHQYPYPYAGSSQGHHGCRHRQAPKKTAHAPLPKRCLRLRDPVKDLQREVRARFDIRQTFEHLAGHLQLRVVLAAGLAGVKMGFDSLFLTRIDFTILVSGQFFADTAARAHSEPPFNTLKQMEA
jgi:hypothetical protein